MPEQEYPYLYTAYGMGIHSAFPLPELVAQAEASRDVLVREGTLSTQIEEVRPETNIYRATADDVLLHYPEVGSYQIRGGWEIVIEAAPEAEETTVRQFLLGACLGVALHQRRHLVLHASAITIDDQVVAFVGEKGQGKSTTAAVLHGRGHALFTDDLLPVKISDGGEAVTWPGFPQLKLWPDALEASLGERPDALSRIHTSVEKRVRPSEIDGGRKQRPLRTIYVLESGDAIGFKAMPPQEAFTELVRHSFLRNLLQCSGASKWHFERCTALLQHVPVVRFTRPRDLQRLPELVRAVEEHVRPASSPVAPVG